ncbi:hypothetical protein F4X10_09245 [Candidatus Poribacteria bacterium]|nr:hypothetical protein [Candidatus Poribacteria bacterium]
MSTSEKIKNELQALLDEQKNLIELTTEEKNYIKFGITYQIWYSRAYKVVEALGNERLEEFIAYYRVDSKGKTISTGSYVIQDYINGSLRIRTSNYPGWNEVDGNKVVRQRVVNQLQILKSLESRIDSVLQDVKGHLLADLQDSELKAAEQLRKVNLRAAGVLAGVVLEGHLQRVVQNHNISIRKKSPTIADLNDPLKNKGVYDNPTWRKIQLLADIRNLCSHKKEREPTNDEVVELISGVNWIIKSVF